MASDLLMALNVTKLLYDMLINVMPTQVRDLGTEFVVCMMMFAKHGQNNLSILSDLIKNSLQPHPFCRILNQPMNIQFAQKLKCIKKEITFKQ